LDETDTILNDSIKNEPIKGRVVRPDSDRPLLTASRKSNLSGTTNLNLLLSPQNSSKSNIYVNDSQIENK
jgi:hypothetical protein